MNGASPRDMRDFVAQVSAADGLVEITTTSGGLVMLDAGEVAAAMPRILARYRIPRDRSPTDLASEAGSAGPTRGRAIA